MCLNKLNEWLTKKQSKLAQLVIIVLCRPFRWSTWWCRPSRIQHPSKLIWCLMRRHPCLAYTTDHFADTLRRKSTTPLCWRQHATSGRKRMSMLGVSAGLPQEPRAWNLFPKMRSSGEPDRPERSLVKSLTVFTTQQQLSPHMSTCCMLLLRFIFWTCFACHVKLTSFNFEMLLIVGSVLLWRCCLRYNVSTSLCSGGMKKRQGQANVWPLGSFFKNSPETWQWHMVRLWRRVTPNWHCSYMSPCYQVRLCDNACWTLRSSSERSRHWTHFTSCRRCIRRARTCSNVNGAWTTASMLSSTKASKLLRFPSQPWQERRLPWARGFLVTL